VLAPASASSATARHLGDASGRLTVEILGRSYRRLPPAVQSGDREADDSPGLMGAYARRGGRHKMSAQEPPVALYNALRQLPEEAKQRAAWIEAGTADLDGVAWAQ
jgi:hypothetical protein